MGVINTIKIGVIITEGDEILLIKEKVAKNTSPLWNIIKGTYGDISAESIIEAAKREAKEEAGVEVTINGLLGAYVTQQENGTQIMLVFTAVIIEGSPLLASIDDQGDRGEDISELKWFSKPEISDKSPSEFISSKVYMIIQDWLKQESYPLSIIKLL